MVISAGGNDAMAILDRESKLGSLLRHPDQSKKHARGCAHSDRICEVKNLSVKHYLPSKIGSYFKRLNLEYERANQFLLHEVVNTAFVIVIEETFYDRWDGGTWGHDIKLFLPPEIIRQIGLDEQKRIAQKLLIDLNDCANSVSNESFNAVHLELADESDPEFQGAVQLSKQTITNPDFLSIWKPGHLRLFISHRDADKAKARELGESIESYGISAFVAHDTIEPMTRWQQEIEKGLETMEVMLAFITDDFHESVWTQQEVGYALGKGVPIVPVKFEHKDPVGFIGKTQALRGDFDKPAASASLIYKVLAEKLGQKWRLQQMLISAFNSSPDFYETKRRFDRMNEVITSLSDNEAESIQRAFSSNDQLYGAIYLDSRYNRLVNFMKRCTGKDFAIEDRKLKPKAVFVDMDDEIPF
jgi:hypothetical protein